MNPWIMAVVGIAAFIGGCYVLRECWRAISGNQGSSDEEREATRAADARQAQFKKTGTYFPPDN